MIVRITLVKVGYRQACILKNPSSYRLGFLSLGDSLRPVFLANRGKRPGVHLRPKVPDVRPAK